MPSGKYKAVSYLKDFAAYRKAFPEWEFSHGNFSRVMADPNDFVYADPPCDVEFSQYSTGGFTWADQVRLVKWLSGLDVPVIISN